MKKRNGMTCSEAGMLGSIKSAIVSKRKKQKRIVEYNLNPTKCRNCNVSFSYDKRHNRFCNRSCSASYNNIGIVRNHIGGPPNHITINNCKCCGEHTKNKKYCSRGCYGSHMRIIVFDRIDSGSISEWVGAYKRYLIYNNGPVCKMCGWSKTNPFTNTIPIILNHIDGNSDNNSLNNLELICPNCDSMTQFYKGANVGNGRFARRLRYKKDMERIKLK